MPMTNTFIVSRPRILLLCVLMPALLSCTTTTPVEPVAPVEEIVASPELSAIEDLLDRARRSASPAADALRMDAARLQIDTGLITEAGVLIGSIDAAGDLPTDLRVRLALLNAELALLSADTAEAEQILENPLFADMASLNSAAQISLRSMRSQVYELTDQPMNAVRERIQLAPLLDAQAQAENRNAIWAVLAGSPRSRILTSGSSSDSYELRGWLELLRLVTSNQSDIKDQLRSIEQWRNTWAQHSAADNLPDALTLLEDIWDNRPSEIALVLPVQEPLGKAISEGFMSAYYDALARGKDVPRVRIYDTSFRTDVLVFYDQAVDEGMKLIIGPVLKDAVRRIQRSGRPMPVPTLALNYGDPGGGIIEDLYQFGLAPEDEIMQAADTAWAAGHRNAAVLTPAGEEYLRIQDTFVSYWSALGGRVVSIDNFTEARDYAPVIKRIFSIDASEARAEQIRSLVPRTNIEFVPRRRQDVDFVFLLANPAEGRQIKPTLSLHFAGDVPVYAMPSVYDGGSNPTANQDLNGIIFNDAPWILEQTDPLKSVANSTWAAASGPVQRLRAMGVDAYRLYLRMEQMRAFPYMSLEGATGTLSILPDGSIHRALRNAVVLNGEASVLGD